MELAKLSVPQLAILSKSSLRDEIVPTQNENLALIEGVLGILVEECKVESSAYECIGLDDWMS